MRRFLVFALSFVLLALMSCSDTPKKSDEKIVESDPKDNPKVVMETSMGKVTMELFQDKAPISVANFLRYVDAKHYDDTIFHRVIKDFMVQGGGMTSSLREKPGFAPIRNEGGNGLRNLRGTLAMARTGDPDSATAQFFINTVNNGFLDRAQSKDGVGYAVFGKVLDGMDVVDKIRAVPTDRDDVPRTTVYIKSIRVLEKAPEPEKKDKDSARRAP